MVPKSWFFLLWGIRLLLTRTHPCARAAVAISNKFRNPGNPAVSYGLLVRSLSTLRLQYGVVTPESCPSRPEVNFWILTNQRKILPQITTHNRKIDVHNFSSRHYHPKYFDVLKINQLPLIQLNSIHNSITCRWLKTRRNLSTGASNQRPVCCGGHFIQSIALFQLSRSLLEQLCPVETAVGIIIRKYVRLGIYDYRDSYQSSYFM